MSGQDIGLVGLGTMGRNLALNFRDKGIRVFGFDHVTESRELFAAARAGLTCTSMEQLVQALPVPRVVCLLVPAGASTMEVVRNLLSLLSPGDVIVDAGNSHFRDTERLQSEALRYEIGIVGMGVSGGEAGARHGPAIMAGGESKHLLRIESLFGIVAARRSDGNSCYTSVGPGGAGHFVKTLHNGIEYADMQLIAEAAFLLRRLCGMDAKEVATVFRSWQAGPLSSYLLEAAIAVLEADDDADGRPLIDRISDVAEQKGTGQWAVVAALELGVPAPCLSEAVFARALSGCRHERTGKIFRPPEVSFMPVDAMLPDLHDAIRAGRMVAFAQGFAVIATASHVYDWSIDLSSMANGWTSGCIIRGAILDDIVAAFKRQPQLSNLLHDAEFAQIIDENELGLRSTVVRATAQALPVPLLASALAWRDAFAVGRLWTDLVQGQRDYFGAHGFERIDHPGTYRHGWHTP